MTRDAEKALIKAIANQIGIFSATLPNKPLTGFIAMIGHLYKQDLMVIGRAVNGWTKTWLPSDLKDELNIDQFVKNVFDSVNSNNSCPMKWISNRWEIHDKEYNTKKSAFWRCIRSMVCALEIADINKPDWPSHLAWSNLYKVSPGAGGNPSTLLRSIQFNYCNALIREELRLLIPRRILFMTGLNWAKPFLKNLSFDCSPFSGSSKYIEGTAIINLEGGIKSTVVVAKHPQGKTESVWVKEVVNEFKNSPIL